MTLAQDTPSIGWDQVLKDLDNKWGGIENIADNAVRDFENRLLLDAIQQRLVVLFGPEKVDGKPVRGRQKAICKYLGWSESSVSKNRFETTLCNLPRPKLTKLLLTLDLSYEDVWPRSKNLQRLFAVMRATLNAVHDSLPKAHQRHRSNVNLDDNHILATICDLADRLEIPNWNVVHDVSTRPRLIEHVTSLVPEIAHSPTDQPKAAALLDLSADWTEIRESLWKYQLAVILWVLVGGQSRAASQRKSFPFPGYLNEMFRSAYDYIPALLEEHLRSIARQYSGGNAFTPRNDANQDSHFRQWNRLDAALLENIRSTEPQKPSGSLSHADRISAAHLLEATLCVWLGKDDEAFTACRAAWKQSTGSSTPYNADFSPVYTLLTSWATRLARDTIEPTYQRFISGRYDSI